MPKNRLDIIFQDAEEVIKKIDFSFLRNKTLYLTGSTGLLGTHFLATLCLLNQSGMNINVFAGSNSEPADYTKKLLELGRMHLNPVKKLIPMADVIIHAAGYAQPAVFTSNPAETIRINTSLTQELLGCLSPGGKFLFLSSSEVYNGCEGWVHETNIGTSTPYDTRACYIEGKRCGEAIVNAYRQSGVDAKSARLCLTYGPGARENDQRAISNFIRQGLFEKKLELKYSGRENRTLCYVQDAMETLWNILLHGKQSVYNVGSPVICTMRSVAKIIADDLKIEIKFPPTADEMSGSDGIRMNTLRAENEFNKKNFICLSEGLSRTVDWHRGFYD